MPAFQRNDSTRDDFSFSWRVEEGFQQQHIGKGPGGVRT
jgi:hypothetical protein